MYHCIFGFLKKDKKERDQLTCSLTETWLCCGLITQDIQTKNEKKKKKNHFHIAPKLVSLVLDFYDLSAKLNSFMLSKKIQEMVEGHQKLCLVETHWPVFSTFRLRANQNNYNGQSHERKTPLRANENSKQKQENCLKRGKTRATEASLSFASDWLIEWRQISEPIREQSKANQYSLASLWTLLKFDQWEGVEDESLSIILLLCHTVIIVHIWSSNRVTSPSRVRMSFTVGYIFFCRLKNRYGFSLCKIETSQLKKDLWSEAKE